MFKKNRENTFSASPVFKSNLSLVLGVLYLYVLVYLAALLGKERLKSVVVDSSSPYMK